MRGIILAGGFGKRLRPLSNVTNKHLLPVYDKPMIYFPLETLTKGGIDDIMILTGDEHAGDFINLLGNGKEFGVKLTYRTQSGAGGIAEALGLCRDFIGKEPMVVILGDNIFTDDISEHITEYKKNYNNAVVFLKEVPDPHRFGVALIDNGIINSIIEKPKIPTSNLAVTGLYFYNSSVWHIIDNLVPSARGELEITDVNNWYIDNGMMKYKVVDGFWSDAGQTESLFKASRAIRNLRNKK